MITLRRLDRRDRRSFERTGMLPGPPPGLCWHAEYPTDDTIIGYRLLLGAGQADPDTSPWWMYHVVRAGTVVGNIGFHGPPDDHGSVEIGYDMVESLWGQGIATRACAAIVAVARESGAADVVAGTDPDNHASQRVLINNGFRPESGPPGETELRFRLRW